ncbi:hypothetical protein [Segatella buccae]
MQAADASWWLVFLAYRNFGGAYHHLGRETFLAPVEWKVGEWPVVNSPSTRLCRCRPCCVRARWKLHRRGKKNELK